MDINSVIGAIGAHNWLLLVLLAMVYARTLFSDGSKFPVTLPPNWRPVFIGVAGAIITSDTAVMGGKGVGPAVLLGVVGFVSGGFLDGMTVAIFGNAAKAPSWAKAIVFVVDDVLGGGGGGAVSVKKTTEITTTVALPTPAASPPSNDTKPAARRAAVSDFGKTGVRLRLVGVLGVIAIAASGVGANCSAPVVSPQTQAEITADVQLGACIEAVYAVDSAKVPVEPPAQIVLDAGEQCGADLAPIISAFGRKGADAKHLAVANAAMVASASEQTEAIRHFRVRTGS